MLTVTIVDSVDPGEADVVENHRGGVVAVPR
jgi:hypothetical protein